MADIFDHRILCSNCGQELKKTEISRRGFLLRALICPKCHETILHPLDEAEYQRFINLKNKEFKVKMRLVGNSYAVSIPREIVNFIKEQEQLMDNMVRLCFDNTRKLSLNFGEILKER